MSGPFFSRLLVSFAIPRTQAREHGVSEELDVRFRSDVRKMFFAVRLEPLKQVFQSCGFHIPEATESLVGWGPEQHDLVGGTPASGGEFGTKWSSRSLLTHFDSVILWNALMGLSLPTETGKSLCPVALCSDSLPCNTCFGVVIGLCRLQMSFVQKYLQKSEYSSSSNTQQTRMTYKSSPKGINL